MAELLSIVCLSEEASLLTTEEMESDDRPVRITVIFDRLPRPNNLIRQRHKISDGRSRPDILEVRSSFRRQAPLTELAQLGVRLRHT